MHFALPDHYLITGAWAASDVLPTTLDMELKRGRKLFQLRIPGWDEAQFAPLAAFISQQCKRAGAQLMINSFERLAASVDGCGLHLKSAQLIQYDKRPLPPERLVSASCHTVHEIIHACALKVDFITVSPVLETSSHPETQTLGWERFEQLCAFSTLPVYALGGLAEENLAQAQQAGATGIAGISGFWNVP